MFSEVISCSVRLLAVQGGYMLFRKVICCSGGLYDEENNDDFLYFNKNFNILKSSISNILGVWRFLKNFLILIRNKKSSDPQYPIS